MASKKSIFFGIQSNKVLFLSYLSFFLYSYCKRDGFDSKDFHKKSDIPNTLTIIQSDGGFLFGGYTSKSWGSGFGIFVEDYKAFIFTLSNPHSIPPTQFPVAKPQKAIHAGAYNCCIFGESDIYVRANSNINNHSYSNFPSSFVDTTNKGKLIFTNTEKYKTKEIEVYSVLSM